MTDAQWLRLSDLVPEALDLPPTERGAFLDDACVTPDGAPDPVLRREAAALVAAAEEADLNGALSSPVSALLPEDLSADEGGALRTTRVGPWRVAGVLGEGGMGVVYRAERADGHFERTVALKVVRYATPHLARRFALEQQVLARLEHPHIARLYDAGVAHDEVLGDAPYLAMELVEGEPITAYADRHQFGVRQRVELLVQVCEAVAYAHGRLVLHRDLKPSNVLVTGGPAAPRAVVLDFGIARLLGDAGDALTQTSGAVLTPEYAAPEQVTGGEVTTATDVFGLGVLLYETLTGHRPRRLTGLAPAQVERALASPPPKRPSEAAPAWAGPLRGDLDTIALKALAPDPAQRYASAEALGDDLRRHLDGLPVQARPATAGYRLRSFVRRNRTVVLALSVALAALVGGLGVALWQARVAEAARDRAEARFEVAREAARAMIYDVHDAIAGLPGATPAREVIVDRALVYLDHLASEADGAPALRVDLAGAYLRIGNVQGSPTDNNLGRTADAITSYRQGLTLRSSLPPDLPDSLAAAAAETEGRLWEKLGVAVAHVASPDSARGYFDRALAAHRRAFRLQPDTTIRRVYLAMGHINRGDYAGHPYFPNAGRPDAALADYARARALLAAIPEAEQTLLSLRMEGITYEREGNLLRTRGDLDASTEPMRHALALRERIAARPDATAEAIREVGVSHEALGLLALERGRFSEAERALTTALGVYERLAAADPESVNARQTLAFGHLNLARLYGAPDAPNAGRPADARRHAAEAARLFRALADGDAHNARLQSLAADAETFRDQIG